MIVERIQHSGGWVISDVIDGYRVKRRYFGMSRREAMTEFRREFYPSRRRA